MSNISVLILADCYLPGFKYGGPVRSLANLVAGMGDQIDFSVITWDRDYLDSKPYPDIPSNVWLHKPPIKIFYLSNGMKSLFRFPQLLRHTPADIWYMNSCFSLLFTLYALILRKLRLTPQVKLVIAPRGVLSPGSLSKKSLKKRVFLFVAKALNLYNNVFWHASTDIEAQYIRDVFGPNVAVQAAPNFSGFYPEKNLCAPVVKNPGELRLIYLGRISHEKNLLGALEVLQDLRIEGHVRLNVFGLVDEPAYWGDCQRVIRQMPKNIVVEYHGAVEHSKVAKAIQEHHMLIAPSWGESYGHSIAESLIQGRPVLISDKTPWRHLEEAGVGYDLPLERPEAFWRAIAEIAAMDQTAYDQMSNKCRLFIEQILDDTHSLRMHMKLFQRALQETET